MCMLVGAITKEFGVIACDSAMYDTEKGETSFEARKLSFWKDRYWVSFVGSSLYFSGIDVEKFALPLDQLSLYLQQHLRTARPDVENLMKEGIADPDEARPYFCMYVLGLHGKRPTIAQFNSFQEFAPKYLWAKDGETIKFTTLLYGDDSIPGKAQIFKDATAYMEELTKKNVRELTPGLVGEILTRGIYHKADLEEGIGLKKKYAGGIVNAGVCKSDGTNFALSGVEILNGSR
jgi:hypothetical protein